MKRIEIKKLLTMIFTKKMVNLLIVLTAGMVIPFQVKIINFLFDLWEIFWSNNNSNNDLKNIQNQETGILCTSGGPNNNRADSFSWRDFPDSADWIVWVTELELWNQRPETFQEFQNAINARVNEVNPGLRDEVSRRLQRFYDAIREDYEMRYLEYGRQLLEDQRRAREANIEANLEENINVGVPNNQQNNDPSIVSDDESLD